MTENAEPNPNADVHHAFKLAVLALTGARAAVECRSTPEQVAQLDALLAGGAQLALAIRSAGGEAHIEFHVLDAEHKKFFDHPLLSFSGAAIAALAPPENVNTFNRGKMN